MELSFTPAACGDYSKPVPSWYRALILDVHYLHFGILLWGISTIIAIVVSLCTEPIPAENLYRLTFWSR
jgi:sodium/glucose cotransporter 1/sodium/glucose cotransporter 9